MRKFYSPLSVLCLILSFLLLPVVKAGSPSAEKHLLTGRDLTIHFASFSYAANLLYDSLQLNKLGLSREALMLAYKGQQKLAQKGLLDNPSVLTVCDFTQSSEQKRMYIVDIAHYKLLLNTYVAHGKNSGLSYASRFSNGMRSLESSLGFYITRNIYVGKNGLSLRLRGLEKGFNDNAERRAVVVHGAPYIGEQRSDAAYMGRSFGCPAVPLKLAERVINLIKDGTCLFIYHPSKKYLHASKILNG